MWKSLKRANQSAASFMREILLANESTRIFRRLFKSNNRSIGFKRKSIFTKRKSIFKVKKKSDFSIIYLWKVTELFLEDPPVLNENQISEVSEGHRQLQYYLQCFEQVPKVTFSMSKLIPFIFLTTFIWQF